jgi:hypothetical protein
MQKPEVDYIEGLSPAIAIEQRSAAASPRSTIATTTEIYDYLRLLFSAVGRPQRERCWINRETSRPTQPMRGILERDGRAPFCRKKIPGKVRFPLPVDVDFHTHDARDRRMCFGNRCSSKLRAS